MIKGNEREREFQYREEDYFYVPIVPAYDLLAKKESRLSDEEVAMVALALNLLTPQEDRESGSWWNAARVEAVSQRL